MTLSSNKIAHTIETPEQAAEKYRSLPSAYYDLLIIGGGSAGLSAAELARALGASVALVDREKLGGECLYTGCVPSKALLHAAQIASSVRRAGSVGLGAALEPVDLGAVMDYAQRAIQHVYSETDAPEHLLAEGIAVAFGEARFVSPHALSLNGQVVSAKHYLIATGSHPAIPAIPGLNDAGFLTNETIFSLRALPERLAVIGGGPIGCELGQAFARLGSKVTIVQRSARLLPKDEPAASATLQAQLEAEGVVVAVGSEVTSVRRGERGATLTVLKDGVSHETTADAILIAIGRAPNLAGLALDAAGIRSDTRLGVAVDANLRTSNPRVYAAGDITGGYHFTHAAAAQARVAVRNALFPGSSAYDARVMPWATFTDPEVAHVGLTEAEARRQHGDAVRVERFPYTAVDRAVTDDATAGSVTLISSSRGVLLGAQIVGPRAGDNINELALAIAQRLTLTQLANVTHVYPTLALAIQQSAGVFATERARRSPMLKLLRRLSR